jgi:hypothetical protein
MKIIDRQIAQLLIYISRHFVCMDGRIWREAGVAKFELFTAMKIQVAVLFIVTTCY